MKAFAVTSVLLCLLLPASEAITFPPLIAQQPDKLIVFQIGFAVSLPCVASANPSATYSWTYNNIPYSTTGSDNRVQQLPGIGTIIINDPRTNDQGYYKCRASNEFGIAIANTILLLNASLDSFPNKQVKISRTVNLGDPQTFICGQPNSFPYPVIYWQKFDSRQQRYISINYDDRIAQDLDGRLHFSNIISSDAGLYQCNVHNTVLRRTATSAPNEIIISGGGSSMNMKAVVLLYVAPVNFVAYRGQQLRLKCIFGGNPTPYVNWKRADGTPIDSTFIFSYGQELIFQTTAYSDAGAYECLGFNSVSTNPATATMIVDVYSTPYFVVMPTPQTRSVGETVTFICKGDGTPKPATKWYINGNLTIASRGKISLDGINMTISNLALEDTMAIQCNVTDDNSGWAATSFYINVLNEPPSIVDPPPSFLKMADGAIYWINCVVFGAPRPVISWKKDGRDLTGGRFAVYDNGTLKIEGTLITDAGIYTCNAANSMGSASANMTALVRRRTEISTAPQDTVVYAGQETKFTCTAVTDGDEMQHLIIDWQKDGQWIDYSSAQRMYKNTQDNSLLISGTIALDTGTYTCVASNGVDYASASAALRVQDVPDQPTNVVITECYQATCRVQWSAGPNNNAPILNYVLQYNTTFEPSVWYTVNSSISDKDNLITVPLSPYVNYTFRVLARNKIGTSRPSYPSQTVCSTLPDLPTKNPTGVVTLDEDPSQLVISWQPTAMIDQNGQGFKYLITYMPWSPAVGKFICPGSQCSQSFIPQDRALGQPGVDKFIETKIYIRGVPTYTPYLIYITTSNEKGTSTGALNKVIAFSGEGTPSTVVNDVRVDPSTGVMPYSASLMWTQVNTNASAIQGFFRGYRVRYWKAATTDANEVILKVTVYIILRDVALEGTDYSVNSVASRKKRDDEAMNEFLSRSKRDATYTASVNGSMVYATITNLPPFSQLNFEVAVINKKFSGPDSAPLLIMTREGNPGPVGGLAVTQWGPTHVMLQWSPPAEPNGVLTGYRLGYRTLDGLQLGPMQYPDNKDFDASTLIAKLTGLRYTQRYRFSVWAYTSAGQGDEYFTDDSTIAPGYPGAPTPTAVSIPNCNNCINVSWVPATTGTPASVFYVQYRQKSALDNWESTMYEPYKSWIKLQNLGSGWVYEVRVIASNGDGYETISTSIIINPSGEIRSAEEAKDVFSSPWFIGLLIGVVLLAIVIVLVFIIQQNKGGKYMALETHESEKLRPYDDDQLPPTRGYKEDVPQKSRAANVYNEKDIDNGAEFHEENAAQFNEEGSFIGAYRKKELSDSQARYTGAAATERDQYYTPRSRAAEAQAERYAPSSRYYQPPASNEPAYATYQPRYSPSEQTDVRYHAASPSVDDEASSLATQTIV